MSASAGPPAAGPPPLVIGRASVARNALALTAATIAARVSMFALGIVLARSLGATEYGRYSLALAVGVVLQPIADFGLSRYLVRETARDRHATERALGRLALSKLGLLAATQIVTLAAAAALGMNGDLLVIVGAMVLAAMFDGWSLFVYCYFQGRESMAFEARATAIAGIARATGAIVLALGTGRLTLVVAWIVLVAAVQAAVSNRLLRRAVGQLPSPRGADVDWRSVASMGMVSIFVVVYLRADTILVAAFEEERLVGLYAAAYTLMLGVQVLPAMLTSALQPVFARTYRASAGEFARIWHGGVRLLVLSMLPVAVVVTVLAEPIIDRTFGAAFAASADVLRTVIWICPLAAVSLASQAVLRAARREAMLVWVSGACAVLSIGLNLWAIPRWGIMGAAATTVATEAVNVTLLLWLVISRGLVPLPDLPLRRLGLAAAALVTVAVLLADAPVGLALVGAIAAYVATLAATGVLRGAELAALRRMTHAD